MVLTTVQLLRVPLKPSLVVRLLKIDLVVLLLKATLIVVLVVTLARMLCAAIIRAAFPMRDETREPTERAPYDPPGPN